MESNNRNWFKAGEFARLCGVTKHTLIHYDDVRVVRPAYVEQNGTRWYSADQFYAMDIVATLQAANMTLAEIRTYMTNSEPEAFVQLLEDKQRDLAREQEKLARMQRVLKATAARTREGLLAKCGAPRLETWKEQPLIATPVHGTDERAHMEACTDHFEYCFSRGIGQELPIGSMVTKENLLAHDYCRWDFYFNPISRAKKCDRLFVRPAGQYAVIDEHCSYEGVGAAYEKLYSFIAQQNCVITGNSYEQDLISYMATTNPEKYVIRIAIQVEKRG